MIYYDEKICVKCLACVSESEFGGVTYKRGRIFFDTTNLSEDWANIASICPVAAIKYAKEHVSENSKIGSVENDFG